MSRQASLPAINVAPNQGKLLHLLALATRARTVLEVGTLAGYSTIWLARALPQGGGLVTIELDPRHASMAQDNIAAAGLSEVVEIIVGPAIEVLERLAGENRTAFDLVFIDADKPNTSEYFELALTLVHLGSLIIVDNVVRAGKVADPNSDDPNVLGMRRFLDRLANEPHVQRDRRADCRLQGPRRFRAGGGRRIGARSVSRLEETPGRSRAVGYRLGSRSRVGGRKAFGPASAAAQSHRRLLPATGTCGAAWSARRPVKPEVAGSNPVRSARS